MRAASAAARSGALATLALAALAFALRALPWPRVALDGRFVFPGNDPWYHARRILFSARHWPARLESDPFLNHPHGGEPIWGPGLDWTAATLARALVDPADARAVEALVVWIPPLLGALTVAWVHRIGRREFGPAAAAWAAGLLALLPAHFAYSRLGFVDHHVAVALLGTGLLAAGMAVARAPEAPGPGRVAGTVALAAAALLVWPGALLEVGLLAGALGVVLLTRRERSGARRLATRLAALWGLAAVLVAPFAWGRTWRVWGDVSPVVLSDFQPVALAALALAHGTWAAVLGLAGRRGAGAGAEVLGPGVRTLASGAAAAVAAGVAWALVPDPARVLADAWGWLARDEVFQAEVRESLPLLWPKGHLDLAGAGETVTPLALVAVATLAVGALRWRRPARRVLLAFALGLGAAALAQQRFAASFAVPMCLLAGAGLAGAGRFVARPGRRGSVAQAGGSRGARAAVALGLALVVVAGAASLWQSHRPRGHELRALAGGEPLPVGGREARRRQLLEVADFLRTQTEPAGDPWAADQAGRRPAWGVLSHWSDGHVLLYAGERPVNVGNFGDDVGAENMALAEVAYLLPEARALEALERLDARFVVFEHRRIRARSDAGPHSLLARLYFHDGEASERSVAIRGLEVRRVAVPAEAVTGLRLRFETGPRPRASEDGRPAFELWERVPGAVIEGRADPGAPVEVRLALTSNRGRAFTWRARARADERGVYRQRVPYATQDAPPGVVPAPAYCVRPAQVDPAQVDPAQVGPAQVGPEAVGPEAGGPEAGGPEGGGPCARVAVREADAQAGAPVAGPDVAGATGILARP